MTIRSENRNVDVVFRHCEEYIPLWNGITVSSMFITVDSYVVKSLDIWRGDSTVLNTYTCTAIVYLFSQHALTTLCRKNIYENINRVTRAACFIPSLLSTDIIVFINEIVHLWEKGEIGLFIVLHLGKIEDGERMKYIRVKYILVGFVRIAFDYIR